MATRQRGSNAQPSKQPPNTAAPAVVTIASSAEGGIAVATPAREERIAVCAYLRAIERGFAPGHEIEDWLAAERELEARGEIDPAAPARPL
jgi:hypothetical protein